MRGGCLALACECGFGLRGLRGGCFGCRGVALGRALAQRGQFGFGGCHLGAQRLDLGGCRCGGFPCRGELGDQLLLLGARSGGALAARRQVALGGVELGSRLHQLGLGPGELAPELDQLGLLRLTRARAHARTRGLRGGRGSLVRQRLGAPGSVGLACLPEHGRGCRACRAVPATVAGSAIRSGGKLCQQRVERGAGRGGRLHLELRHHGDVVDRQRVGRVGHGHQQPAADESHRHRAIALGGGRPDQGGRVAVHLEARQVDVGKPVALGGRARELLLADRAAVHKHLRNRAAAPRLTDGGLDRIGGGEAQLDDHVAQEARAAPGLGGRHDALRRGRCGGAGLGAHAAPAAIALALLWASVSMRASAPSGDSASPSEQIA